MAKGIDLPSNSRRIQEYLETHEIPIESGKQETLARNLGFPNDLINVTDNDKYDGLDFSDEVSSILVSQSSKRANISADEFEKLRNRLRHIGVSNLSQQDEYYKFHTTSFRMKDFLKFGEQSKVLNYNYMKNFLLEKEDILKILNHKTVRDLQKMATKKIATPTELGLVYSVRLGEIKDLEDYAKSLVGNIDNLDKKFFEDEKNIEILVSEIYKKNIENAQKEYEQKKNSLWTFEEFYHEFYHSSDRYGLKSVFFDNLDNEKKEEIIREFIENYKKYILSKEREQKYLIFKMLNTAIYSYLLYFDNNKYEIRKNEKYVQNGGRDFNIEDIFKFNNFVVEENGLPHDFGFDDERIMRKNISDLTEDNINYLEEIETCANNIDKNGNAFSMQNLHNKKLILLNRLIPNFSSMSAIEKIIALGQNALDIIEFEESLTIELNRNIQNLNDFQTYSIFNWNKIFAKMVDFLHYKTLVSEEQYLGIKFDENANYSESKNIDLLIFNQDKIKNDFFYQYIVRHPNDSNATKMFPNSIRLESPQETSKKSSLVLLDKIDEPPIKIETSEINSLRTPNIEKEITKTRLEKILDELYFFITMLENKNGAVRFLLSTEFEKTDNLIDNFEQIGQLFTKNKEFLNEEELNIYNWFYKKMNITEEKEFQCHMIKLFGMLLSTMKYEYHEENVYQVDAKENFEKINKINIVDNNSITKRAIYKGISILIYNEKVKKTMLANIYNRTVTHMKYKIMREIFKNDWNNTKLKIKIFYSENFLPEHRKDASECYRYQENLNIYYSLEYFFASNPMFIPFDKTNNSENSFELYEQNGKINTVFLFDANTGKFITNQVFKNNKNVHLDNSYYDFNHIVSLNELNQKEQLDLRISDNKTNLSEFLGMKK